MLHQPFKKVRKRIPQATDRSALPQSLGHLMQILVVAASKCVKENKVSENSQHGFMKGKFCLINVITFCHEVIGFAGNSGCHFLWLWPKSPKASM